MSPAADRSEQPSDADFRVLLEFRDGLRRFLRWSEAQAREAGLTPTQHQLLLAIRGHGGPCNVSDVADHLLLRHHSAVELVDRAVRAGLVVRRQDPNDHRVALVELTRDGAQHLDQLSASHVEELSRVGPRIAALWRHLP